MALPSNSTPRSSSWPRMPLIPVSGLRTPIVSSTRSCGSLSFSFPSGSHDKATDFANRANGLGSVTVPACDQDLFRHGQHPGVDRGGQGFDGGHDGPGLLDADHPVGQCLCQFREHRVRDAHRRVGPGGGPFSRCSPVPGRPGRRSSTFPGAARRWTRTRTGPRCCGCRPPRRGVPARRTRAGPDLPPIAPTTTDPVLGPSRTPSPAVFSGRRTQRRPRPAPSPEPCPSPYQEH